MVKADDRRGLVRSTELGYNLFGRDGWDPYLEDIGTIWLLHWLLVRGGERASTWHLVFSRWNAATFNREQLVTWLLLPTAGTLAPAPSSLHPDSLRQPTSYGPPASGRQLRPAIFPARARARTRKLSQLPTPPLGGGVDT